MECWNSNSPPKQISKVSPMEAGHPISRPIIAQEVDEQVLEPERDEFEEIEASLPTLGDAFLQTVGVISHCRRS